jgi:aspartate/methionine/tyrosine aminotransferase
MHYDFGFGEAKAVREVLGNFYSPHMGEHHEILSIRDMGYPGTGPGLSELIDCTKKLITVETGLTYKYVVIAAGASNAINSLLRVKSRQGYHQIYFRKPYFSHYPKFANKCDFEILNKPDGWFPDTAIDLIDSPSNPEGIVRTETVLSNFIIWDATYHNSIYSKLPYTFPKHDVMVGSFGKFFGINGIRLGWIALNNQDLFLELTKEVYEETLGVSLVSQRLALNIFDNILLEKFTKEAALQIDCNREEMSKLEYLSEESTAVPLNGMFYWTKMDNIAQNLLEKAGVHWIKGGDCGADGSYVRLNLAQDRVITRSMVKAVLKQDGKKI